MKRTKKVYLLLGIFVVISAAAFLLSKTEEKKEQIKNSDEVILEIDSDTVEKLSWEYDSQNLAFHKDEEWMYDEDDKFPVDEEKINNILGQFEEFGVSFIIEEAEDLGQYGLDDPECTIQLETEEDTYEILLGDYSTMDSKRYVSIGDGNVYLVNNDPMEYFDVTIKDMIHNDETPEFEQVSEISFSGSTSLDIIYEEDNDSTYCEDDVYFVKEDDDTRPLDTTLVKEYLSAISSLSPEDYVTYDVSEEDLASYGLDSPEFTVGVEYTADEAESSFSMQVGRDKDETAYVRIGESKIIYEISEEDYEEITDASYDTLRHREVITADLADVSQIEVTLEKSSYTISVEEKKEELVCSYEDEEIEDDDFIEALQNLEADSFTDKEPTEKKEIGLKIQFNDEKYPELEIDIYRYDGTSCLVVIAGEPVALAERNAVVDLVESVNAIVLN